MKSEGPLSMVEEVTEYHSLQAVAWSSPVAFNQAYSESGAKREAGKCASWLVMAYVEVHGQKG